MMDSRDNFLVPGNYSDSSLSFCHSMTTTTRRLMQMAGRIGIKNRGNMLPYKKSTLCGKKINR